MPMRIFFFVTITILLCGESYTSASIQTTTEVHAKDLTDHETSSARQEPREAPTAMLTQTPMGVVKTFSALCIVLGVILGIGLLFKYLNQKKWIPRLSDASIQIEATKVVGPKKSLSIIRVAHETFLIGITDTSISLLAKLNPSPSEFERTLDSQSNAQQTMK